MYALLLDPWFSMPEDLAWATGPLLKMGTAADTSDRGWDKWGREKGRRVRHAHGCFNFFSFDWKLILRENGWGVGVGKA